ncbi:MULTISPECIES: hypothetical protein [Paenibacillus]|uniref:hypothetical protein n=1 Tax=Paenibacillus TaxID=44249 RepID=UPI0022B901E8|nr:hypothetical protein [Paenibacillus caseinilyticus]MCZ8518389.1 hypothetical protein [Paenibacillus caseinilyticus]
MLLKKTKAFMLLALSIVALHVSPSDRVEAAESYACDGSPGVYIYQDGNYSGACYRVGVGDYANAASLAILNDSASSIRMVPLNNNTYYEATLYENANYTGATSTIRFGSEQLGQDRIGNDRLSSMKVKTITADEYDGVYLFEHAVYHGDWIKLTAPTPDLAKLNFNDKASSVHIVGRYSVGLYQDVNFTYRSAGLTMSCPYLNGLSPNNMNDNVSSVLIQRY